MLNKLATQGRHYKLGILLSTQWIRGVVSASIRNNIDFLFFSDINIQALKIIYEIVYTDLDFKSFFKLIDNINNNYTFILYDNHTKDKFKRWSLVKSEFIKKLIKK